MLEPDIFKELMDLRGQAVREDFATGDDAGHQVELSHFAWAAIRKAVQWDSYMIDMTSRKFWGMFQLKLVADPLPDMSVYSHECGPDCKHEVEEFIHIAMRIEKTNGRFVYFDWAGNNDDFR